MTVHMFRVFIGRGKMDISDLESRINNWVESKNEWTDGPVDHELSKRSTESDGSGDTYYVVDVRFNQSDTKDNILQKLTDKLKKKVDWYRVGYHACTHDESDSHPCSWDNNDEWTAKDTTIPEGVPDLTVDS